MTETNETEHAYVTLTLRQFEAEKLYVEMIRARNGLRESIRKGHIGDAGYFFGWLDACMTKMADNCPQRVKRQAMDEARGDARPLGGGGNKPN